MKGLRFKFKKGGEPPKTGKKAVSYTPEQLAEALGYRPNTPGYNVILKEIKRNPQKYSEMVRSRSHEFTETVLPEVEIKSTPLRSNTSYSDAARGYMRNKPGGRDVYTQFGDLNTVRNKYATNKFLEKASEAVEFIPGVGDVISVGKALVSGKPEEVALATLGIIPGGDLLKGSGKVVDYFQELMKISPAEANKYKFWKSLGMDDEAESILKKYNLTGGGGNSIENDEIYQKLKEKSSKAADLYEIYKKSGKQSLIDDLLRSYNIQSAPSKEAVQVTKSVQTPVTQQSYTPVKKEEVPKTETPERVLIEPEVKRQESKVFDPEIKDYENHNEMFTDFLEQGRKQGIEIDRNSKLYKRIRLELPKIKKFYKGLNLSDDEIADAMYLSSISKQAQDFLEGSQTKDLVYHGTLDKFREFKLPELKASSERSEHFDKYLMGLEYDPNKKKYVKVADVENTSMSPEEYLRKYNLTPEEVLRMSDDDISEFNIRHYGVDLLNSPLSNIRYNLQLNKGSRYVYTTPDRSYARDFAKFRKEKEPQKKVRVLPFFINTGETKNIKQVSRWDIGRDKSNPDTYFGNEYGPVNRSVLEKIPVYAVGDPRRLKSLLRYKLGVFDKNNPDFYASVGAGTAAGALAASQIDKEQTPSKRKGGLIFKKGGWIQKAIKKPGSLTAAAKRAGMSISEYCKKPNLSTTSKRRCNLAKTLRSFKR